ECPGSVHTGCVDGRPSVSSSLRGLEQIRPRILVRGRLAIRLQRVTSLPRQVPRNTHLDGDQQITAGAVLADRALAPRPHGAAVGRARRQLQRDRRASQGRDSDHAAERRLRGGDGHGDGEVVALAAEHRVGADVHDDVQVARRTAALARGALAAQPDALPVADARGNAHLHGPRGLGPAAALADVAGVLRDQPAALAVRARVGQGEAAPAAPRDLPGTDTGRAHARCAVLVAGAGTGLAGLLRGHAQRDRRALDRLGEAEGDLGLDVLPAPRLGARGARAAPVEQAAEDVTEAAAEAAGPGLAALGAPEEVAQVEVEGAAARPGAGTEPAAAEQRAGLVVLLALLGVTEDVVRLGDLLEALLRLGVALVGVRVELAGELPVRLLDLGLGG